MHQPLAPWRYDQDTLERYAELLLWGLEHARKQPFRKSDLVLVRYDLEALPLAEAVVCALHRMGRIPVPRAEPTPHMQREFYNQANNKRLTFEIPGDRELCQHLAGGLRLVATPPAEILAGVDPELMRIAQQGKRPLQDLLLRKEQSGSYSWCVALYPSPGGAAQAGMPLADYAREIQRACLLTNGSPLNEWKLLRRRMQTVTDRLNALPIHSLRLRSEHSDLLLRLGAERRFVCFTGRNIPSFEIYTSPDWRGTEGHYLADVPSFRLNTRIEGLRLEFRRGEAVRLSATRGGEEATEQLRLDPGATRVGEFALVDRRFSPITRFMADPLYDENLGGPHGSCHIALGQAYANTYSGSAPLTQERAEGLGFNHSALHWDLVSAEPREVFALLDGGGKECIYRDGQFTLD